MINSDIILGDFVGCSGTWTWKESCGTLVYLMGKGGSSNQRHLGVFITGYQAPVTMDRVREDILSGSKHGGFHKWGYPHSWMVSNGKSNEIGWFRGTPILGNPPHVDACPFGSRFCQQCFHRENRDLKHDMHHPYSHEAPRNILLHKVVWIWIWNNNFQTTQEKATKTDGIESASELLFSPNY